MRFLIIDDCPSRYDEFTRMLDREKISWVITCDPETVDILLEFAGRRGAISGILLDHDMPHRDGREWAHYLVTNCNESVPVIITSCTGIQGAREEMLETLRNGGFKAVINPADHGGCEIEWLSWMKGCLAGMENEAR